MPWGQKGHKVADKFFSSSGAGIIKFTCLSVYYIKIELANYMIGNFSHI